MTTEINTLTLTNSAITGVSDATQLADLRLDETPMTAPNRALIEAARRHLHEAEHHLTLAAAKWRAANEIAEECRQADEAAAIAAAKRDIENRAISFE